MDWLTDLLVILTGLALRLGIPLAVTALAIYFLRRLDARWRAEAQGEVRPRPVEKPQCWKVKGCTPEQRRACPAAASPLPCWQFFRQKNGYLRQDCLACRVFQETPLPLTP